MASEERIRQAEIKIVAERHYELTGEWPVFVRLSDGSLHRVAVPSQHWGQSAQIMSYEDNPYPPMTDRERLLMEIRKVHDWALGQSDPRTPVDIWFTQHPASKLEGPKRG